MSESAEVKEFRRKQLQGLGKPIDSWTEGNTRFLRVNDRVCQSSNWKTFEDFLFANIKEKLTPEWGEAELSKPKEERHPILQWYVRLANFQTEKAKTSKGQAMFYSEPTGAILGFLNLAYYLYLCEHHGVLTEKILQRLKDLNNFEGALYELYVTASFLKAGFLVELEDEGDPRETHHEFTATHSSTGRKFSVEARARYLSSKRSGRSNHAPRVKDKLNEALKKKAKHERIVFIELNRAEYTVNGIPPEWIKQIEVDFGDAEKEFVKQVPDNPAAYVFVTNQSFMHWLDDAPKPPLLTATGHNIVDFPASKRQATMEMIVESHDKHSEIYDLLDLLGRTSVPSSFDDRTPEEFCGLIDRPMIGMMYAMPDQEGKLVPSELIDGQVLVKEKRLFGQFRTDKGVMLGGFDLSDYEIAAYLRSPETFLGEFSKQPGQITDPYHCYEFVHRTHRNSSREFLVNGLQAWYPPATLSEMNEADLVKLYCINMASLMWQNAHPERVATA